MVLIRDAGWEDLPAMVEIQNARLLETTHEWTEIQHSVEEWSDLLASKEQLGEPVLVAERAGEVIGWTTYSDFRNTARWECYRVSVEHTVHVRRDSWGQGVGRLLLDALSERASRAGKKVMVAGIDSTNTDSIVFHTRMGFTETARMPGVGLKWGRRLDLVLMQKELV